MTVETFTRKQNFAGGQATLTFSFKCLEDHPEYIKVLAVSSGTETALTYDTDYTVALEDDGVGGVVTLITTYSTAYTHTVYRETENKQESDYDDYNQFPADTLEEDLDRRTLASQEISEDIDRSVKLGISSTLSSLTLPEPEAGKALKWNDAATGLENTSEDIDDYLTASMNYATTASTAASLAGAYATTASTAAASATLSAATCSSASANVVLAGLYAATASTQATLASNYATTASTAATLAGNYATTTATAVLYAATASTQATLAGLYASTASTQATSASTSATLAGNYATSSSTSAALAGNYATTASTYVPSIIGNALKYLRVNATSTGTEWADTGTGGTGSLPTGGTTGQSLTKASEADYDVAWTTVTGSAGGSSGVRGIFTQTTVTTGSMLITFSTLGTASVLSLVIADSNGTIVIPDSIICAETGATVSVTSFMPISGTWRYYYIT